VRPAHPAKTNAVYFVLWQFFTAVCCMYVRVVRCSELDDLVRSHAYLTDLVERMSIPVFADINVALQCTKTVVQNVCFAEL